MKYIRILISVFGAAGATFLLQIVLARTLSIDDYGKYAAVNSILVIVAPLASAGIGGLLLRRASIDFGEIKKLNQAAVQSLILTSASAVAFTTFFFGRADFDYLIVFLLSSVYFSIAAQVFLATQAQLERRYNLLAATQGLVPCTRLIFVLLAGFFFSNLRDIAVVLFVANFSCALLLGFLSKEYFSFRGIVNISGGIRKFFLSMPYAINGAINVAQIQLTVTFAAILFGTKEAALLSVAITALSAIYIIPNATFGIYLLPRYHRANWSIEKSTLFKHAILSLVVGVLVALFCLKIAAILMVKIFGIEFSGVINILRVLIFGVPLRFYSTAVGAAILSENSIRWKIICSLLAVFIQCCAYWFFSFYGIDSMAYAVLFGEIFIAVGYTLIFIYFSRK